MHTMTMIIVREFEFYKLYKFTNFKQPMNFIIFVLFNFLKTFKHINLQFATISQFSH